MINRLFGTSFGSHNYGLNDETSDRDYRVFYLPTYDMLYDHIIKGKTTKRIDGNDYEFIEIRSIVGLMRKCNPSYLEIFDPNEVMIYSKEGQVIYDWIIKHKKELGSNNLSRLTKSIRGMMIQKQFAIRKDLPLDDTSEGGKRRLKYGFDTKQLVHIKRLGWILDNLDKGVENLIKLPEDIKVQLKDVKANTAGLNKETALIEAKRVISNAKVIEEGEVDQTLYDELSSLVRGIVLDNIRNNG